MSVEVVFTAHGQQARASCALVPSVGSVVRLLAESGVPHMTGVAGRAEWVFEGRVLVGVIVPLTENVGDDAGLVEVRNDMLKAYATYSEDFKVRAAQRRSVVVYDNELGDLAPPGSITKTRATATPMRSDRDG